MLMKRVFILALATGFYVGYVPGAPGTIGSLWGLAIAGGLHQAGLAVGWQAVVIGGLVFLGVPICGWAAEQFDRRDPGPVVFDEFASLPVVFLFVPWDWRTAMIGFAWFRVFDILKPWPTRGLERLPGGWGIMADDLMAAFYAAAVTWLTANGLPMI
ncbi:MAG TPA: phosphatidylglycerophosphatase A [Planctomycetaceae bacterium]|nr:phosphatidylglycerophosphatase A [Planctomycetaceae bacterium]